MPPCPHTASLPGEFRDTRFKANMPDKGWPRTFGIVTAHDPNGQKTDPALNKQADEAFLAQLKKDRHNPFRVIGGSPTWDHAEDGYGIPTGNIDAIRAYSRAHQQLGFFWVENGTVYLWATEGTAGESLGTWESRLDAIL